LERISWTGWEPWRKLWEEWVRYRAGEKNIVMEHIQFIDLYNFFVRQAKALAMAGDEVDVKAFLAPDLTYDENKKILAELMRVPPTEKDYESMYEGYKAALESEVKEKFPEVWKEWEKRIQQLERETERLPKVERDREKFKQLSEELARELEQTRQRSKQEKEGLEKKVAPVKLRILRGFKEGIIEYSAGSIVETRDIDWAIQKMDQGFAERVGVEPMVKPPAVPLSIAPKVKHKFLSDDQVEALWQEFVAYARMKDVKAPEVYRDRLMLEIKTAEDYETAARRGRRLVETILEEIPRLPAGWKRLVGGYLTENGKFVPEEEYLRAPAAEFVPPEVRTRFLQWVRRWEAPEAGRKAYQLHPKDWLLQRGITWGDFLKKPDDERKALLDEYERLMREQK